MIVVFVVSFACGAVVVGGSVVVVDIVVVFVVYGCSDCCELCL